MKELSSLDRLRVVYNEQIKSMPELLSQNLVEDELNPRQIFVGAGFAPLHTAEFNDWCTTHLTEIKYTMNGADYTLCFPDIETKLLFILRWS